MKRSMKYLIVIEKSQKNYSAYVPDLPGCIATGRSIEQVRKNIRQAIDFHLDGLREDHLPIPRPTTMGRYVSAKVA